MEGLIHLWRFVGESKAGAFNTNRKAPIEISMGQPSLNEEAPPL